MDFFEKLNDLPLSSKTETASIFELLSLPKSASIIKVRKAYDRKIEVLTKESQSLSGTPEQIEVNTRLSAIEKAFQEFSTTVKQHTESLYESKQALDAVQLDQSAEWDTIENRYKTEIANAPSSEKDRLAANFQRVSKHKDLFKKNPSLSGKTIYATIGVMAAAGVTIAALSQFSGGSILEAIQGIGESTAPEVVPISTPGLDEYIETHQSFEDELLSSVGAIPDIHQTLELDYKIQLLGNLINQI